MSAAARPVSLALDIGATKIAAGFVPDDDPTTVLAPYRSLTQGEGLDPHAQVRAAIARGWELAEQEGVRIERIGMGAPGVVEGPRGLIRYNGDTLRGWAGTDLGALAAAASPRPVPCAAHNDVRIMAYGEYHLGAGRELPEGARILVVSLGTGVGGAIIDAGELLGGPTAAAGEISELRCADLRGLATRCESSCSGTGLCRYYHVLRREPETRAPIPWALSPGEETLPEILARDDELISRILDGNLRGFGEALGAIMSAWDLSAIIVGGGVAELGERVLGPLREGARSACLSLHREVPIMRARLGGRAPLVGAARYAVDHGVGTTSIRKDTAS